MRTVNIAEVIRITIARTFVTFQVSKPFAIFQYWTDSTYFSFSNRRHSKFVGINPNRRPTNIAGTEKKP